MNIQEDHYWELISGHLNGELEPEQIQKIEDYRTDPNFSSELSRIKKIHDGIKEAGVLRHANKQASWFGITAKLRRRKIKHLTLQSIKYAAVILLAFATGLISQRLFIGSKHTVQYAEVDVQLGQTGHLFLFDGTEVWLNSGSKLSYPNQPIDGERPVELQGEAFFKVTADKHLPFKVKTKNLEVEVVGTSFNVTSYPGDSTQAVVLVEGKVRLNNTKGERIGELLPGQIAVSTNQTQKLSIENTDPQFYTGWKDGKVVFRNESLADIAKKLERWYNVEISFEQEQLKNYKMSGTILRNKPVDQTLAAMEILAPVRFVYSVKISEKNKIAIVRKN